MRIAFVHNPTAGHGDVERDDLHRLFESCGHRVEMYGKKKGDVKDAIASEPDVLAVAGGDGTVAKAAILSFKKKSAAPLFILPIGTANNIARSLGIDRTSHELIRSLAGAVPAALDIGCVRREGRERFFVEGAGVGFLGAMLRHPMSTAHRLRSAIHGTFTGTDVAMRTAHGVANLIREQPALSLTVTADATDLSGDYIAVEALNIREVGPHLMLAPRARPGDGLLDLALYRASDAEEFAQGVQESDANSMAAPRIQRARTVTMTWRSDYGHIDDKPWPDAVSDAAAIASITIAGQVMVLLVEGGVRTAG